MNDLVGPKFVKLYKVSTTADEYGRYGATIGYFTFAHEAEVTAERHGYYGGPGQVDEKTALVIAGQFFILESPDPVEVNVNFIKSREDLKKAALAKLSPAEKAALGLKED
jgi:hypothetical protein